MRKMIIVGLALVLLLTAMVSPAAAQWNVREPGVSFAAPSIGWCYAHGGVALFKLTLSVEGADPVSYADAEASDLIFCFDDEAEADKAGSAWLASQQPAQQPVAQPASVTQPAQSAARLNPALLIAGGVVSFTVPSNATVFPWLPPMNPSSKWIGAGKPIVVAMVTGYWLFNYVDDNGCRFNMEGLECNVLLRYDGAPVSVMVPEGSVWWFRMDYPVTKLWWVSTRDSMDDVWPNALPTWLELPGVTLLDPPMSYDMMRDAPTEWLAPRDQESLYVLPTPTPARPTATPTTAPAHPTLDPACAINNVIARGDNMTATGCGWMKLTFWTSGVPEKMYLFYSDQPVVVSGWSGSFSSWDHVPNMSDVGTLPVATKNDVTAAGITIAGSYEVFTVP